MASGLIWLRKDRYTDSLLRERKNNVSTVWILGLFVQLNLSEVLWSFRCKRRHYFSCEVFCDQPGDFEQCSDSLLHQHQTQLWLIVAPLVDFTAGERQKGSRLLEEGIRNLLTSFNNLQSSRQIWESTSLWIKMSGCFFFLLFNGPLYIQPQTDQFILEEDFMFDVEKKKKKSFGYWLCRPWNNRVGGLQHPPALLSGRRTWWPKV